MDERTHIYSLPDCYIGSIEHTKRKAHVAAISNDGITFKKQEVGLPAGIVTLFNMLFMNALDSAITAIDCNADPGSISVNINSHTIEIKNDQCIPIKLHEGIFLPTFIFTQFNAASNYTREIGYVSRHNTGCKPVCIFSKICTLDISDPVEKLQFSQIIENNALKINPPIVTPYNGKTAYTKVSFQLDFPYFNMTHYSEMDICTLMGAAYILWKKYKPCKVLFNGIDITLNKEKIM